MLCGVHTHTAINIFLTKNKNYLGIRLTKEVKDLYNEKFKILKKETKEVTRRWRGTWIGRVNIVKMAILAKAI